ncbi:VWFA and cache domain-containing protein 1-like [Saccostrea cucullata]|uniref:VWFA and cache domain-containing protein 1-like n=1 Tax=Saccostrea cuccullata TaxID=36930 RepID=UPI002ECFFCC2
MILFSIFSYLVIMDTSLQRVTSNKIQQINATLLAEELQRLVETAGWKFLQEKYNELSYVEANADGQALTNRIAKLIGNRMEEMNSALRDLKQSVDENFSKMTSSNPYVQCCTTDRTYTFDPLFRAKVSKNEACASHPSYVNPIDLKYPNKEVLETMINNHKSNRIIKNQYLGLKSGLILFYPATKLVDCDSYDPRFRPYYVSSTSYKPRDVVIVLDISTSMMGEKLYEARQAVITVMETLGHEDRIGIVVFNKDVYTPKSCYGEMLVPATRTTKQELEKFISAVVTGEGSNYSAGLRRAFEYFTNNSIEDIKERDQVILFVTDGENTGEDNPLKVIREKNHQLQNRVAIHTYGIGTGLSSHVTELLKNMSTQVLNDGQFGPIKTGNCNMIEDLKGSSLREIMGMYYYSSSIPISQIPTYTLPYKDFLSKEFVISGCLPIGHKGDFIGVVCADIRLSELVPEIIHLQHGEHSYAFIIDGKERTLVHPLFPDPRDANTQSYDVNNIFNFETAGDVDQVIISMKKKVTVFMPFMFNAVRDHCKMILGQIGHKRLTTTMIESRGDRLRDGDLSRTVEAVYTWVPINVSGSNLSLCVVMEKNTTIKTLESLSPKKGDFLYHRWDLIKWPTVGCIYHNRYATKDKTSVKFTADAYEGFDIYKQAMETETEIYMYEQYISGVIQTNPGLKKSALNSLRATSPIERFWRTSSGQAFQLLWRYVMTEDGVVRVYPGVRLSDDYDPNLRPWYRKTLSQKTINVVSPPYEDLFGGMGRVITLSRSILIGRSPGEKVEAVVGADLSVYFLHQMLLDLYPLCRNRTEFSCIVIDDSGFLVMHPYFTETTNKISYPIHITHKEMLISKYLTSEGILYQQPCRDTENKRELITFRVKLPQTKKNGVVNKAEGYELRPVPMSNLFLILKSRHMNEEISCCKDPSRPPNEKKCLSDGCLCLCYEQLEFNDCENKYQNRDTVIPCSHEVPKLTSVSINEISKIAKLDRCFPLNCTCRNTESECFRSSGCSWCTSTVNGERIKGFCHFMEVCPHQQCLSTECESKCEANTIKGSKTPIWVYVIALLCFMMFLGFIVACIVYIVRRIRQDGNDTYMAARQSEPREVRTSTSTYQELVPPEFCDQGRFLLHSQTEDCPLSGLSRPALSGDYIEAFEMKKGCNGRGDIPSSDSPCISQVNMSHCKEDGLTKEHTKMN